MQSAAAAAEMVGAVVALAEKKFATRRKINLTEMQGSEMITSYTESSSGHLNDFNSRGSETRCCSVYT